MFNFMKKKDLLDCNPDFALKLFQSTLILGGGNITPQEEKKIKSIAEKCKSRQELLNKIIEICGTPTTPKARYVCAMAYSWSNKEYREKAVESLNLYLNNELYEGAYKNVSHASFAGRKFSLEEERNIHISNMLNSLGKKYEELYQFEEALNCYEKAHILDPYQGTQLHYIAKVYIKMNRLEEIKIRMEKEKQSNYYEPVKYKTILDKEYIENSYKMNVDSILEDINKKIEKGYVYRPRKKK